MIFDEKHEIRPFSTFFPLAAEARMRKSMSAVGLPIMPTPHTVRPDLLESAPHDFRQSPVLFKGDLTPATPTARWGKIKGA